MRTIDFYDAIDAITQRLGEPTDLGFMGHAYAWWSWRDDGGMEECFRLESTPNDGIQVSVMIHGTAETWLIPDDATLGEALASAAIQKRAFDNKEHP